MWPFGGGEQAAPDDAAATGATGATGAPRATGAPARDWRIAVQEDVLSSDDESQASAARRAPPPPIDQQAENERIIAAALAAAGAAASGGRGGGGRAESKSADAAEESAVMFAELLRPIGRARAQRARARALRRWYGVMLGARRDVDVRDVRREVRRVKTPRAACLSVPRDKGHMYASFAPSDRSRRHHRAENGPTARFLQECGLYF